MLKSFNISDIDDGETLGIGVVNDRDSPYYGRIPIPTLLDAQIDELWMEMIERRRKHVLSQLTNMIYDRNKRENWYGVFLTTLILMLNLEAIFQNQHRQKGRYGTVSSITLFYLILLNQSQNATQEDMISSWEQGAKNLLWHFRLIFHGEVPLQMNWNEIGQQVLFVDSQAQQFLTDLKKILLEHGNFFHAQSCFFANDPD